VGAIADDGGGGGGGRGGVGLDRDMLLWYLHLWASVCVRQLGYVGSDFSMHLPPASPALLFYFALPSRRDPMRRLVLYAVAGAALSWMHAKCTKYRRFSPLPGMRGVNVQRPDLPTFLPPEEEGYWAGGLGVDGGKMLEKTDPSKMMAASLSNNCQTMRAALPHCLCAAAGRAAAMQPQLSPLARCRCLVEREPSRRRMKSTTTQGEGVGGAVGGKLTTTIRCPAATVTTNRRGTHSNPLGQCCPCTGRGSRVAMRTRCNAPSSAARRRRTNSLRCAN
jgi:hypothetical protein